ncbi:hypothetical protein D3C71_1108550 [compost metagenome]
MATDYSLNYIGKKLVKVNPALGIHSPYYVHVVSFYSNYTDHAPQLDQIMKLDDWNEANLGFRAYSMDPTDDGEWFKFKKKDDADKFYQAHE